MSRKPIFVLVRQWCTIPADLQRVKAPVLPRNHSTAFLPTQRACSQHVLQRLNGNAVAISESQVLQVRGKQWSFGLRVDLGEDFEVGVSETGAVYDVQLRTKEILLVEPDRILRELALHISRFERRQECRGRWRRK